MKDKGSNLWRLLSAPGVLWLAVLYVVPLVLLAVISFTKTDIVGKPDFGKWTTSSYSQIVQPMYVPIILRTIVFSLITVALCVVLGYIVAYTISKYGGRYKVILLLIVLVPWLIDYLIRIYSWMQIFSTDGLLAKLLQNLGILDQGSAFGLLGTDIAVIIGLVYNFLPFALLPIYVSIQGVDEKLVEASRDLYASSFQAFWKVTFVGSLPGVIAGGTLTFLLTFGDFVTAKILGGPDQYMLGNLIQDQFSGMGAMPFGAAITIVVLVIILVILGVFTHLSTRAQRRFA